MVLKDKPKQRQQCSSCKQCPWIAQIQTMIHIMHRAHTQRATTSLAGTERAAGTPSTWAGTPQKAVTLTAAAQLAAMGGGHGTPLLSCEHSEQMQRCINSNYERVKTHNCMSHVDSCLAHTAHTAAEHFTCSSSCPPCCTAGHEFRPPCQSSNCSQPGSMPCCALPADSATTGCHANGCGCTAAVLLLTPAHNLCSCPRGLVRASSCALCW